MQKLLVHLLARASCTCLHLLLCSKGTLELPARDSAHTPCLAPKVPLTFPISSRTPHIIHSHHHSHIAPPLPSYLTTQLHTTRNPSQSTFPCFSSPSNPVRSNASTTRFRTFFFHRAPSKTRAKHGCKAGYPLSAPRYGLVWKEV
jgi:hypothetical protein